MAPRRGGVHRANGRYIASVHWAMLGKARREAEVGGVSRPTSLPHVIQAAADSRPKWR